MIQGIIDAYFEDDGELILVDYKTDRTWSSQVLLDHYKRQLDYYERALTQLTGKKSGKMDLFPDDAAGHSMLKTENLHCIIFQKVVAFLKARRASWILCDGAAADFKECEDNVL